MSSSGFAVIDFETTGLFPGRNDRVIEVAVVHVDDRGNIEGQWETLVNPERDLGRQEIHGIRAAEVISAPRFAGIADELLELVAGRTIVAHNASFDVRFLLSELGRLNTWVPSDLPVYCTMQGARELIPGAGRSLADCCAAFDIELNGAHCAAVDALATARLLAAYLDLSEDRGQWDALFAAASEFLWPSLGVRTRDKWVPRTIWSADHELTAMSFLERITEKMPDHSGPDEHVEYLALLDRCLLDRHLSVHESHELASVAEELGLARSTCELLHRDYFQQLTAVAWQDGVLTTAEMADLVDVGNLLEIPSELIASSFAAPPSVTDRQKLASASPEFVLEVGDLVVLTGEMSRQRSEWEQELSRRGIVPWPAVTKKVKLVVAADPDSLSGKARKARDYGIPIVDERALNRLLS